MGSEWVKRLYDPGPLLFSIEVMICAIGVPAALMSGDPTGPLACMLYTFSAYVLGIGIYYLVLVIKWIGRSELMSRLDENRYRIEKAAMYFDLIFSVTYAVILTVSGIDSDSAWMYAAAGYYLIVGSECFILVRGHFEGNSDPEKDAKRCLSAGIVMFLLTIAVITMVGIAVNGQYDVGYPGIMIYIVALFTFIFFATAIVNVIRYRGFSEPVFSTVKRYKMSKAVYSMFVLQLAMFASFGSGDVSFEQTMNYVIGALVCTVISLITVYQLYHSYRLVKGIQSND